MRKDYGTHIRVSRQISDRLSKICKSTGKKKIIIAEEIFSLGIEEYEKMKKRWLNF